jgi:periplasmic protein CpxP/Spy
MMRRRLAGVVGAAALAVVATTAYVHGQAQDAPGAPPPHARRGPGGPGGPFGFRGPGGPGGFGAPMLLLRQLDLTEDQRTQVRQVMDSHRDELKAVGERLTAAHKVQNDAITATQFDESAVRAATADLAAVLGDAAVLHAKVHSEVFALLTPEQQAKAAELKAAREARAAQLKERVRERIKSRVQRRAAPQAQ